MSLRKLLFSHFRVWRRPSNQLMMFWPKRLLKSKRDLPVAVDVGCGKAINRRFFRNSSYIGVDVNEDFLAFARARYPRDTFEYCSISSEKPPAGDLVVCTLVPHNKHFPAESTVTAVRNLVASVNPGGTLTFTTSSSNNPYVDEVEDILRFNFKKMEVNRYGRFNKPSIISHLLAF